MAVNLFEVLQRRFAWKENFAKKLNNIKNILSNSGATLRAILILSQVYLQITSAPIKSARQLWEAEWSKVQISRWGNVLVFTETSSGKYYRRQARSNIQAARGARRRAARDATLSKFQALPFARLTLITFRVLKRNYLGPFATRARAASRPPSGNEARWKNKKEESVI